MSAEDREEKFERALAQHMREGPGHKGCPDAETLAAYHERSLSLDEMAQWKKHIAGCAACQETLSLVEVTDKQLAEEWEERKIPVPEAAAGKTGLRSTSAKADFGGVSAAVSKASAAPVSMVQKRRPGLVRWAIPLGAVAAGLLVWIGIHEGSALRHAAMPQNVQVAETRPQARPAAPSPYIEAPKLAQPAERDQEVSRLDAQAARNAPLRSLPDASRGVLEPKAGVPASLSADDSLNKDAIVAKKMKAPEAPAAGGAVAGAAIAAVRPAPPPPPAPNEPAPAMMTETVEVTSAASSISAGQKGEKPVDLPPGQGGGNTLQDQKHVAVMGKARTEIQQSQDANADMMGMKQGVNGREFNSLKNLEPWVGVIVTPDHKVWWKLGTGGNVELTTDGGKKWKTVDTGVTAQLMAGSAPSSKVCWIAGKAGTLVLTSDHGNHWTKLATPITGDLGGVHAADAKHATIWDTGNRLSYETSDGGATWKQTANQ